MPDLRIIFMGTPEFAVPSLEILIENRVNVVAVVTAPDKPQGRGQKLSHSPVKQCALKHNLPVLQPTNLKSPDFQAELKSYGADLQVVVAFRMLPEPVWAMPKLGTFNLHASLLPSYRGAAPINWALINGEKETGVTTFFLQQEIDTGKILFQEKEAVLDNDDAGTLYEKLRQKGAGLVLKTVQAVTSGKFNAVAQSSVENLKPAPKIFKEDCKIDWNHQTERIRNFVRGLSPYPAAWCVINQKQYKIFKVSPVNFEGAGKPGDCTTDDKTYLYFKTSDHWISVEEIQAEGKRRMTIREFFMGNKLAAGG